MQLTNQHLDLLAYYFFNCKILCLDIDECSIMHGVCGDGDCQNIPGSFQCKCKEGYETSQLLQVCTGNHNISNHKIDFSKERIRNVSLKFIFQIFWIFWGIMDSNVFIYKWTFRTQHTISLMSENLTFRNFLFIFQIFYRHRWVRANARTLSRWYVQEHAGQLQVWVSSRSRTVFGQTEL